MTFDAEIRETKQYKSGLDNLYSLKVVTDNPLILDLGKLPSDATITVTVELNAIR
jgi:hypothetical protein